MANHPWSEPEDAYCKALWLKGKSCSEIRDAVNRQFGSGRTRNAIIGRLHRQGLNRAHQGPKAPRALDACRPKPAKTTRHSSVVSRGAVASLGKKPKVVGIDYKLTPASKAEQEACRRAGLDRVSWVEAGAGVQSLNARPFAEATGCRWPLAGGLVCCNPKAVREYCAGHARVAYERPTKVQSVEVLTRFDNSVDRTLVKPVIERTLWDEARLAA
jgi:hypothetical protein